MKKSESDTALCALIARLLGSEIDSDLLLTLRQAEISEVFNQLAPGCIELDLEDAAAEYCRLFVLPGGAPPVAAAWLPGNAPDSAAPIAGIVSKLQSSLELELPSDLPPDHISVLLAIYGWLLATEPAAADDFMAATLTGWVEKFASALRERADLPIYRATAEILRATMVELATVRS